MTTREQGGTVPGPVSFETMVTFIRTETSRIMDAVSHLGAEMDRHQEYHRGLLEEQIRTRSRNGFSWAQTIINVVVATVAIVSLIVTLSHVH
jgi:hypothetical protein